MRTWAKVGLTIGGVLLVVLLLALGYVVWLAGAVEAAMVEHQPLVY